jgi:hypothetical protein
MSGTFDALSGKVASATVTDSVANFLTSPVATGPGCYKWKVTLTTGSSTVTQTTDPFPVRPGTNKLVDVAVIGDSYSAGNGTLSGLHGSYPADGSHQSPLNYASVLTKKLNAAATGTTYQLTMKAWSGATINGSRNDHGIITQTDDLDPHTSLVLMTAGGNDLGFTDVIENCLAIAALSGHTCEDSLDSAIAKIAVVMTDTQTLLSHIQNRLVDPSHSRVILVGYPYLIRAEEDLPGLDGIPSTKLRAAEDAFSARQQSIIDQWNSSHPLKVTYWKTAPSFNGHEPEPYLEVFENPKRWINEFGETAGYSDPAKNGDTTAVATELLPWSVNPERLEWYHPNITGHAQIADELFANTNIQSQFAAKSRSFNPSLNLSQLATVPNVIIRAHVAGPRLIRVGGDTPI